MEGRNQLAMDYSFTMANYPDILDIVEVSEITGYHRNSVANGATKAGELITYVHKYLIPKPSLLEFMMSSFFKKGHYENSIKVL